MIDNNQSMKAVLGRWRPWPCWRHESTYVPSLSVINQNSRWGHVCRLTTSGTLPVQNGPHRLTKSLYIHFQINYQACLHNLMLLFIYFFQDKSPNTYSHIINVPTSVCVSAIYKNTCCHIFYSSLISVDASFESSMKMLINCYFWFLIWFA